VNHGVSRNALFDILSNIASIINLADLNERSYISLIGSPISDDGDLNKNLNGLDVRKLINMVDPVADQDYATKKYHDDNLPPAVDLGVAKESDDVIHSNNAQQSTESITYDKVKEIIVYENLKGLRVSWEFMGSDGFADSYTKIYVNGIAVGVEKFIHGDVYTLVSDDISDLSFGDLLQIYGHRTGDLDACFVKNMVISYVKFENNDP